MLPGYLLGMLVIYSLVFTVGIVGNVWVIISLLRVVYHNWNQQHSTFQHISLYIISLSFVDFFVLCMIPLLMSYFLMGTWEFGFVACKLFWTMENVNKLLSVAILAIMSFERFMAVCRPFKWAFCKTTRSVAIILSALVSSIVMLCAPIIYYADTTTHAIYAWNRTEPIHTKILCSSDLPDSILPFFIMYMFVLGFLIPVVVISLCYIFIIRHIRAKLKRGGEVGNCARTVVHSILRVAVFHFVCWTPFWFFVLIPILSFFNISLTPLLSSPWVATLRLLSSFLPYINSAGNWIFYAALNRELMRSLNDPRHRTIHRGLRRLMRVFGGPGSTEEADGPRPGSSAPPAQFLQRFLWFAGGELKTIVSNRTTQIEAPSIQGPANESIDEGDFML